MAQKIVGIHLETYDKLLERKLKRSLEDTSDYSFNDIILELLEKTEKNCEE